VVVNEERDLDWGRSPNLTAKLLNCNSAFPDSLTTTADKSGDCGVGVAHVLV
jgi:hypothetical protein